MILSHLRNSHLNTNQSNTREYFGALLFILISVKMRGMQQKKKKEFQLPLLV